MAIGALYGNPERCHVAGVLELFLPDLRLGIVGDEPPLDTMGDPRTPSPAGSIPAVTRREDHDAALWGMPRIDVSARA